MPFTNDIENGLREWAKKLAYQYATNYLWAAKEQRRRRTHKKCQGKEIKIRTRAAS